MEEWHILQRYFLYDRFAIETNTTATVECAISISSTHVPMQNNDKPRPKAKREAKRSDR